MIYTAAVKFNSLLNTQYNIVIAKKGVARKISLVFSADEFYHLAGLHKLTDINYNFPQQSRNVLAQIAARNITQERIESSVSYNNIATRIKILSMLDEILDSNELIFRYDPKRNNRSVIIGDYLLVNILDGNDIYIFLSETKTAEKYFCRSLFPRQGRDYTDGQAKYTLLYKEKVDLITGEVLIQYNRLNEQRKDFSFDTDT